MNGTHRRSSGTLADHPCAVIGLLLIGAVAAGILAACSASPSPATPTPAEPTQPSPTAPPTPTATATTTPLPTPTPTPSPRPTTKPTITPTPLPEPLRCIGPVADILPGGAERLRTACDGTIWLVTDQGVAELDDGTWSVRLTELTGAVAGIDGEGRIWVAGEEYGDISGWDGSSWTVYGAEAGWSPLVDTWYVGVGWGQCDPAGRFWLATSQDVRSFDGETWTVFAPEDMGMGEIGLESCVAQFEVTVLKDSGDVWIGQCDSTATGPCGGQGARWFDGSAWHGSDSPVSRGCVAAIEEDSAGNVWLGADGVLWRYQPASGDWTEFALPEELPFGYRRHGAVIGLAADPFGRLWVASLLCGGASCDADALYDLRDGVWTLLPGAEERYYVSELRAVTDAAGRSWLFANIVYRLTETGLTPAAELFPVSVAVDGAGTVCFLAHDFPHETLCTIDAGSAE